jgi:hypothetical protein
MSKKPEPYHIVVTPSGVEIRYLVTPAQAAEHFDIHVVEDRSSPIEYWRGNPSLMAKLLRAHRRGEGFP